VPTGEHHPRASSIDHSDAAFFHPDKNSATRSYYVQDSLIKLMEQVSGST
jgi:hypothetical protein